eukprot:15028944-Alexandrium_andersonii.AAC.1
MPQCAPSAVVSSAGRCCWALLGSCGRFQAKPESVSRCPKAPNCAYNGLARNTPDCLRQF